MAKLTGVRRRCAKNCGPDCRKHKFKAHVELPAGPDGKRRQFSQGGFETANAASEWRAELLRLYSTNKLPTDDSRRNETVGQYLARWINVKVASGALRPSTAYSYRGHVERYLIPELGEVKLRDLRRDHIENALTRIRRNTASNPRPVGPTTARRILATLQSAIRDAVDADELTVDHTRKVRLAKAEPPRVKPLS
jgi:hypothetical protein